MDQWDRIGTKGKGENKFALVTTIITANIACNSAHTKQVHNETTIALKFIIYMSLLYLLCGVYTLVLFTKIDYIHPFAPWFGAGLKNRSRSLHHIFKLLLLQIRFRNYSPVSLRP